MAETARHVYNLEIERTDVPSQLLKDQLTWHFEKGALESLHIWSAYQMNFNTTIPERGDTDSKFDVGLINVLIDGKFKGGKENFRIMLDPTHRSSHIPFMEPFFSGFIHRISSSGAYQHSRRKLQAGCGYRRSAIALYACIHKPFSDIKKPR